MRAASRLYGKNSVENREKVKALPPEFVTGSIVERVAFVESTDNPEVLSLAQTDKPLVKAALLRNPKIAPEVLTEALTGRYSASTFDIVSNPNCPVEALNRLTETGSTSVRLAAAKALIRRGEGLDTFAKHSCPKIRGMVGAHTKSLAVRDGLLDDTSVKVRERAVQNHHLLDAPLLIPVVRDRSRQVRETAAKTTRDRAALAILAQQQGDVVAKFATANTLGPETPEKETQFRREPVKPDIDALAASHVATADELAHAYIHPETTVEQRIALAANPFSTGIMKMNHLDHLPKEVQALLAYQTEDPSVLSRLSKKRSVEVRKQVLANPFTPRKILEDLAGCTNHEVASTATQLLSLS